mgnify:CR=1 FL=1
MAKMTKTKILLVLLVIVSMAVTMIALIPSTGIQTRASSGITELNQIDDVPISPVPYLGDDYEIHPEIPTIGGSGDVFWHFVDTGASQEETPFTAFVEFEPVGGGAKISATLNTYKLVGVAHYGVYTPFGYELTNAYLNGHSDGNFNLSHTYFEQPDGTTTEITTEGTTVEETTVEETTVEETTVEGTTVEETTVEETTTEGTTEILDTTVVETTVVDETTIELTTETIPLATTIALTTEDIPQTGERPTTGNGLLIGLVLLALAGGLTFVVLRRKQVRE